MIEKVIERVKVEMNADFNKRIDSLVLQAVKTVFQKAFQGYAFTASHGRYSYYDDVAAEFADAISKKVKQQFDESMRDAVEQVASESIHRIENYIYSESFIDNVISRIQRKQLL